MANWPCIANAILQIEQNYGEKTDAITTLDPLLFPPLKYWLLLHL